MKYLVVTLFCITCVAFSNGAETYSDKYDKIDLDAIIRNDRLFRNYVDCLLEKGPCRPDGLELKNALSDALLTECKKCTKAQQTGTRKIIHHLIKNKRPWWDELETKYDPSKVYVNKYKDVLVKEGIVL